MSRASSESRGALEATDDLARDETASRIRYRVLGWACLLAIITYLHRAGFSAIAPDLLKQLQLDDRALARIFHPSSGGRFISSSR